MDHPYETVKVPREGDIAEHLYADLDPREVAAVVVDESGNVDMIFLKAPGGGAHMGPFEATNYAYTRRAV